MSPEEYAEMFARTYGYSPTEGNSYLFCDEKPEEVDDAEYYRYRDFSGAVQYMDHDYLVQDAFDDDNDSEYSDDYAIMDESNEASMSINATDTIHGFPLGSAACADLLTSLAETRCDGELFPHAVDAKIVNMENNEEVSFGTLVRKCPCFCLCIAVINPVSHDCYDCVWCKSFMPMRISQALVHSGAKVFLPPERKVTTKYPHVTLNDGSLLFPPYHAFLGSLPPGTRPLPPCPVKIYHDGEPLDLLATTGTDEIRFNLKHCSLLTAHAPRQKIRYRHANSDVSHGSIANTHLEFSRMHGDDLAFKISEHDKNILADLANSTLLTT
jgi:hypothetical protein